MSGRATELDGMRCFVAGGDGALVERVVDGLTAAGAWVVRAEAEGGRVESRADAERTVAESVDALGTLDALVCLPPAAEPIAFADLTPDAFDATVAAAFRAPFLLTQAVLPRLRAAGRGRLVYVTSTLAISGRPETAHTAAAEHAVVGLMRTATLETEPPLTANAIATGVGPGSDELDSLVDLLTLVLRPASDYLTGQILKTAGGAELHA